MTDQREHLNKAIIRRFLEGLDKNLTAIDEFFTPNCLAYLPGSLESTDRDGFKQFGTLLYTAFPDLHHTVEDQIAENDKVVSRVTVRGSHQGDFLGFAQTGKHVMVTDIIVTRLKEGKVVELWAQFDALGLLQQLGLFLSC